MLNAFALIVAAGRGSRAGGPLPKQFQCLGGRPVLRHTVETFTAHPRIRCTFVVIHPDDLDHYSLALEGLALPPPILGGASRQDSVRLGLEALAEPAPDLVLIHDGARPLVQAAEIDAVLDALAEADGAIAALRVHDTLKRVADENGNQIKDTVDRKGLWRALTPQGFRYGAILNAHRQFKDHPATDDAALAELGGLHVAVVQGHTDNIKITMSEDLVLAERLLASRLADVRVGTGFDVHRLGPGDHVWLCGIKVPHSAALIGHSDADVGLHALTDAILGALGDGDIGQHFPPGDPRWRGADSSQFLRHAVERVQARGGLVAHLDVTLICEAPKISPLRDQMGARIAEIVQISRDRVSVKATTTEKLGFTGRHEGIAAQAAATIRLPG
ncbi:MAG TPA: bifunctional 2-C-methyl-D-erythritol 4-phosphate cytidylyltransferase/2-C-methyl-D-erythritol 2,4-cyclodiphosphate synthase [Alphaproteobacteria bacterium]|nr:bifunctional 2-C-methyl-D-erythritol 4-phosphate cytidylyltransferase/2-C-methyl-D-erythritol 2,4-cyclodiphosphate synthase [Alphaproteobacteria bacterium]HAJ45417.1 bifunctional 2-C-methyl-D-erythritol 4-phosphate cytidylyltransferase/2-C-methyl-D-erythritol 2,4-cyclodiphosphate synthase [Alphaproteobacteria bacterium]